MAINTDHRLDLVTPSTGSEKLAGTLVLPKTTNVGIQVDTTTPTWGWRDLMGPIDVRAGGVGNPTWATFITNINAYRFAVNDECWINFHIPHDYVPGTDLFLHTHWAITTTSTANVTWSFDLSYAKGHNQAAFPATVNTTVVQAGSGIANQHMIAETQITGGALLTLGDIEVDGIILAHIKLTANATGVDPFLFCSDIHYQSSNMATKNKAPGFYA